MKALVTGGTGFLGKTLSLYLKRNNFEVTILGRNPKMIEQLKTDGFRIIPADLTDLSQVAEACENQDYVFHCGALSSVWGKYQDFYATNVIGTRNIIHGCMLHHVKRLIHVSTPSIYFDFKNKLNISEVDPLPCKLVNAYAQTKLLAEREIDNAYQNGLDVVTIRPRGIFGPGDAAIIPRLLKAHELAPLPLFNEGRILIDMTYVDNVVNALVLCMNASTSVLGKKFNITNDEPMFFIDLLEKLFSKLNLKLKTKSVNYKIADVFALMLEVFYKRCLINKEPPFTRYTLGLLAKDQTLDISAAKNLLGYQPIITIEEGLDRYAASLRGL